MSSKQAGSLDDKVATALAVVDRLVSIASGFESDEWMAKFLAVQNALAEGRFKNAVREEARLTPLGIQAKWVVSGELAKRLEKAVRVLARQLQYPEHSEPVLELGELPTDVTKSGTLTDERERIFKKVVAAFKRDPLEENDDFKEVLDAASDKAERELADHPMKGGIGFCHVFWRKKQEILRGEYGLEWKTPAEMNPRSFVD